jgi:hypothetical protein
MQREARYRVSPGQRACEHRTLSSTSKVEELSWAKGAKMLTELPWSKTLEKNACSKRLRIVAISIGLASSRRLAAHCWAAESASQASALCRACCTPSNAPVILIYVPVSRIR